MEEAPGKKEPSPSPTPSGSTTVADNKDASTSLKPAGPPSRPTIPVPEPVADPLTCPIVPGKETTIEILTDNYPVGINFIGGKDTPRHNGIILLEIYPGGAFAKDGRLQPGDQVIEANGVNLRDVTHATASQALRQTLFKMKLTIFRPINIEFTRIDVELLRKPGKGLGINFTSRQTGGVYVSGLTPGSVADKDGRIVEGDLLVSLNGQNLENANFQEVAVKLKIAVGKVCLTLNRYTALR